MPLTSTSFDSSQMIVGIHLWCLLKGIRNHNHKGRGTFIWIIHLDGKPKEKSQVIHTTTTGIRKPERHIQGSIKEDWERRWPDLEEIMSSRCSLPVQFPAPLPSREIVKPGSSVSLNSAMLYEIDPRLLVIWSKKAPGHGSTETTEQLIVHQNSCAPQNKDRIIG